MSLDKNKISRLTQAPAPKAVKTEEQAAGRSVSPDEPAAAPTPAAPRQGIAVGRRAAQRKKHQHVILDGQDADFIDDIIYRMRKASGRRVSMSEVVRVALREFAKLKEPQQMHLLGD